MPFLASKFVALARGVGQDGEGGHRLRETPVARCRHREDDEAARGSTETLGPRAASSPPSPPISRIVALPTAPSWVASLPWSRARRDAAFLGCRRETVAGS